MPGAPNSMTSHSLSRLLLGIALGSALGAQTSTVAPIRSAAPSAAKDDGTGPRLPPERFEARVVKVYAAQDGEARFRAYVVTWKGQEVIASDSLARTDFKVGETITVLAMNHPFPRGQDAHRLLGFTVVPPPAGR